MVMAYCVVFGGRVLMARGAKLIALVFQLQRVRVVAIATLDSLVVHLALNERTVNVHFVFDLAIGVVRFLSQKFVRTAIVIVSGKTRFWMDDSTA